MFEQKLPDQTQLTDEQILQFVNSNPELKAQYDQFKLQKKVVENMNSNNIPLTDKEYMKIKDITQHLDKEGGIIIEPTPNFAIKGFEKKTHEKVFINVLTHHVIDEPEQKDMIDAQNQSGIRVPMSVGSIKEDHDVKGEICKVIDVIVNPSIAENMNKDNNVRELFCGLIQNYFLEKFKLQLADNFTFPKMKYKGKSIEFQRVKGKKPPKISVVKEEKSNSKDNDDEIEQQIRKQKQEQFEQELFKSMNNDPSKVQQPEWEIYIIYEDDSREIYDGEYDIQRVSKVLVEIKMPLIVSGRSIDLQAGKDCFYLRNGRIYQLALKFPFELLKDSLKGAFITEKRILQISGNINKESPGDKENVLDLQDKQQKLEMNIELDNNLLYDIV